MKITKKQLKKIIKEEYSKLKSLGLIKEGGMSDLYIDIQNDILELAQDQGGEVTVDDVLAYMSGYANDPMGDPRAGYAAEMDYDEVFKIMSDMVEEGMLDGGYEDIFFVPSDYM